MTTPAKTRLRYSQADRKRGLSNAGRSDDLLLSIISDYQEASKYRLTPSRLVQIIADADAGDPREQAALFPTLLEKEPLLAAHLNTRRLAVLSKPWRVRSEKQPELADEITDARERLHAQVQQRAEDAPKDKHAQVVFSTVDEWRQIKGYDNE